MYLLLNIHSLMTNKGTIWENTEGYDNQYICKTSLYFLSILSCAYNIGIDVVVGAPGNFKDVVYGLKATEKRFLSMLMKTANILAQSLTSYRWSFIS